METNKDGFSGRIIKQQTITGNVKLLLLIVAWKNETPNIKHNYHVRVDKNWFFGEWKIVSIDERGESYRK